MKHFLLWGWGRVRGDEEARREPEPLCFQPPALEVQRLGLLAFIQDVHVQLLRRDLRVSRGAGCCEIRTTFHSSSEALTTLRTQDPAFQAAPLSAPSSRASSPPPKSPQGQRGAEAGHCPGMTPACASPGGERTSARAGRGPAHHQMRRQGCAVIGGHGRWMNGVTAAAELGGGCGGRRAGAAPPCAAAGS